jgi:hypothetical protein
MHPNTSPTSGLDLNLKFSFSLPLIITQLQIPKHNSGSKSIMATRQGRLQVAESLNRSPMHDAVMESTKHVVESPEGNHITASFLTGRSSSDSPCSESVSRNYPITIWSDDHLFSEEASSKREACISASTSRVSHSSSEQTSDPTIMYARPGEEFSPVRTWWFRLTKK